MRKRAKLTYLIYLVLVLVLAGNASAIVNYQWDGGGPNTLWNEPLNWEPDGVPGLPYDSATLNIPDANCLIDSNVAAATMQVIVGDNNGPCYLNMTGGSLTTTTTSFIADETDSIGTFTMSGGTATFGGRLLIGDGGNDPCDFNAVGTLIMTGGEFTITGEKLVLGKNKTGIGYVNIHGGSMYIGDDIELGNYGTATMVMTAGDVNVFEYLKLAIGGASASVGTATVSITDGNIYLGENLRLGDEPYGTTGYATVYLEGGDVNCDAVRIYTENGKVDINEGTLVVRIDAELDLIYDYVSEGFIIGYGGEGIVDVNFDGENIFVTARLGDPNLARTPNPGRYATVPWTPAGPNLVWAPGRYADNHDVYFGTDKDDVTDANRDDDPCNVLVSQGQDPCTHPFPAPPPVLGQTYYWRIDEVNDACAPNLWKGDVWQFTMANYVVVEDFEYTSTDDLNDVWILTGSAIEVNETIVKPKSAKSMQYEYTNGTPPYYTEAVANTIGPNSLQLEPTVGRDWTTADIKALVVNFYGKAGNATTQMYVALKDTDSNTAVVYYDDLNDINEPEWHEWNIKLSDFNDINDVNLSSIDKVYIGFGNRQTPTAGGTGTVYFDDIRLYIRRCVVAYGPDGDIDEDCDVDLDDFSLMAGDWREKDSTRPGSDADVNGTWVNDQTPAGYGGPRGRCIELDGINNWVDLDDSDFSNFHNKTIAFWVLVKAYPDIYRYMFYFTDEADDPYRVQFLTYTPDTYKVRARFLDEYTTDYLAGQNFWTHLAFVLEDTPDGRCTGKFYADGGDGFTPGEPYYVMAGRPRHSGDANGVNIGSEDDGKGKFVNARFDDFRAYDYALSGSEIAALYNATKAQNPSGTAPDANMLVRYTFDETAGTTAQNSSTYTFYHPLLSDAELDTHEAVNSRVIDFYDLAILVDDWLQEKLWP